MTSDYSEKFTPLAKLVKYEQKLKQHSGWLRFQILAYVVAILISLSIGFNLRIRQPPIKINFNQSAAYQAKILSWIPPIKIGKHLTRNFNLKEKSNG